jgi:hypothetical protein
VSDEAAAELAVCDLWCATMDETRKLLPGVDLDLLFAFVLEPDGAAPSFVRGPMPKESDIDPRDYEDGSEAWLAALAELEQSRAAVDAKLASELHAAIAPDDATVERRARLERAAFESAGSRIPAASMTDDAAPTQLHADFAPAWFLARLRRMDPKTRSEACSMATEAVARRWGRIPPPCTRWAELKGCIDVEIEYLLGDPDTNHDSGSACGIGYVPDYSRRFLVFYLKAGR